MRKLSLSFFRSFAYQHLSWLMLVSLVLLQALIWQPILSAQWADTKAQERKQRLQLSLQHKAQDIVTTLATQPLYEYAWLMSDFQSDSRRWRLSGEASLENWQQALDEAHEVASLVLLSVVWQRREGGEWFADFLYQLVSTELADPEFETLPKSRIQTRESGTQSAWQLVSTLFVSGKAMGLLRSSAQSYWVTKGTWLPEVGVFVETVSAQQVTLVDQNGQRLMLNVLNREFEK
ncbi:hypothetical protein [Marinomonas sp.]